MPVVVIAQQLGQFIAKSLFIPHERLRDQICKGLGSKLKKLAQLGVRGGRIKRLSLVDDRLGQFVPIEVRHKRGDRIQCDTALSKTIGGHIFEDFRDEVGLVAIVHFLKGGRYVRLNRKAPQN